MANHIKPKQMSEEERMRNLASDLLNLEDTYPAARAGDIYNHFFDSVLGKDKNSKTATKKYIDTLWDPLSKAFECNIWNRWTFLLLLCFWMATDNNIFGIRPTQTLKELKKEQCLLGQVSHTDALIRPYFDCNRCSQVKSVPIETSMDKEKFAKKYAYTGVPVLIKGVVKHWPAMHTFSFKFFKDLYSNFSDAFDVQAKEGQFFGYSTEFGELSEALLMDRYRYKQPWYFGWSNNHPKVAEVLREQYERPEFIPTESEASSIDWMFMGKPGKGAFMHIDMVQRPSWQAQIRGRKTWLLHPVPECYDVCPKLNVTVETGDIFVVDTNVWYHSTEIQPGDLSITIGSEYD